MKDLYVVKVGGNVVDDDKATLAFAQAFAAINAPKILVHGGGKLATTLGNALGIKQQMIDGRRITDADTLQVVTMVYAGQVNKKMVTVLQANGCNAFGFCGADGNAILAHKRLPDSKMGIGGVDYGFAGDVDTVNSNLFDLLLHSNLCPVVAPITHNSNGQLLNTNADTIASSVAVAMSALYHTHLVYCFEKPGVLLNVEDETSVIGMIDTDSYRILKSEGKLFAGMLPKLENAFAALHKGVKRVIIGGANDVFNNASANVKGTIVKI